MLHPKRNSPVGTTCLFDLLEHVPCGLMNYRSLLAELVLYGVHAFYKQFTPMGLVAKGELSETKRFYIYTIGAFCKQFTPMGLMKKETKRFYIHNVRAFYKQPTPMELIN
jgi:hypothetical protein